MPVLERLKYAVCVLIAVTMIFLLTFSVSEGLGIICWIEVDGLVFHPLYVLPVFALGYACAPLLSKRVPISGDSPSEQSRGKPLVGYSLRVSALALLAFVLAMLANLAVFLLGRVA